MKNANNRKFPLPSTVGSQGPRRPAGDTQIQDDFDDLVMRASRGDSRAVGAIGVALGPMILEEARVVLGRYADEDEDVLQDFLVFLLERRSPFRPAQGRAVPWMCRVVRAIARTRREENEWRALNGG